MTGEQPHELLACVAGRARNGHARARSLSVGTGSGVRPGAGSAGCYCHLRIPLGKRIFIQYTTGRVKWPSGPIHRVRFVIRAERLRPDGTEITNHKSRITNGVVYAVA